MGRKKELIDLLEKLVNNPITNNKYVDNYTKEFTNRHLVKSVTVGFFSTMFFAAKPSDKFSLLYNFKMGDISLNRVDQLASKISSTLKLNGETEKANEFADFYYGGMGFSNGETRSKKLIEFLKKIDDNKDINKLFNSMEKDLTKEIDNDFNIISGEKQIQLLDKEIDRFETLGYDMDKYIPEAHKYTNHYEKDTNDYHPFEKQIKELKEKNKEDLEFLKALDIASHATAKGIEEDVKFQSDIAEKIGVEADHDKQERIYDSIKENNPNIIKKLTKTTRLVQLKDFKDSSEVSKEILKDKVVINDNDKEIISLIFKKMEAFGIAPTSGSASEQVFKTYAFTKLADLGNDIKKELEAKDIDKNKIIALTKEYEDLEKKYDELLEDVSKLGDDHVFVSNVSSSRESGLNEKYRSNVVNVSKLNSIWIASGYFKSIGKNVDDFLKDPLKNQKEASKYFLSNETPAAKLFSEYKDNRIEFLKICLDINEHQDIKGPIKETKDASLSTDRGANGISSLISDEKARLEFEKQMMIYVGNVAGPIASAISDFWANGIEINERIERTVVNFLIAPDDEFNIFAIEDRSQILDPETMEPIGEYNVKTALEKGGANKPIKRLMELRASDDIFEDKRLDSITKTLLDDIENSKIKVSSNTKHIISFIKKGEVVPTNLKTNLNVEIAYDDILKNGVNKDNIKDVACALAQAKQEYEGRSIFAKWFFKGVRNQGKLIQNTELRLFAEGVNKNKLDKVIDAYKNDKDSLDSKIDELKDSLVQKKNYQSKEVNGFVLLDIKELDEEAPKNKDLVINDVIEKQEIKEIEK